MFEKRGPFNAVIHFGALKSVGESWKMPLRYYQNNLTGTFNLLETMNKFNCKKIIFSSSATVYGADPVPITEESPVGVGIANPYGRTKYMMEQVLTDLATADKEWSVILLRYFNPVGAHESGEIGESPNGIPNNLMPYIQQVAIGRRPYLSVFGNDYDTPDGTGVRDYIHIYDLAQGHLKAIQYLFGTMKSGTEVFNLGTGRGYAGDAARDGGSLRQDPALQDRAPQRGRHRRLLRRRFQGQTRSGMGGREDIEGHVQRCHELADEASLRIR